MRVAFAAWKGRIAPVFDVARSLCVVDVQRQRVVAATDERLAERSTPEARAARIADLGVDLLVCGAITRTAHATVRSRGIALRPFVAGELNEVIAAWIRGTLDDPGLAMPGCRDSTWWRDRPAGAGSTVAGPEAG